MFGNVGKSNPLISNVELKPKIKNIFKKKWKKPRFQGYKSKNYNKKVEVRTQQSLYFFCNSPSHLKKGSKVFKNSQSQKQTKPSEPLLFKSCVYLTLNPLVGELILVQLFMCLMIYKSSRKSRKLKKKGALFI